MTMLVVGGARSVLGAVVGAIAIATVNELLRGVENGASLFGAISIGEAPGLAAIGLGLILLATMIAMPNGLSGGREAGELPWLPPAGLEAPRPPPEPRRRVAGRAAGRARRRRAPCAPRAYRSPSPACRCSRRSTSRSSPARRSG